MFVCEICGCNDSRFFGSNKGKIYCRKCITFKGEKAKPRYIDLNEDLTEKLDYKLSEEQEEIATKTMESYANSKNTLIYAVCGARQD